MIQRPRRVEEGGAGRYNHEVIYTWDPRKASRNLRKHGVPFEEAATVFLDPIAWTFYDPDHSLVEDRTITIGFSRSGRVLFVSHCEEGEETIRIISARKATPKERSDYAKTRQDFP